MMFLDCPAYLDQDGIVRCGLPAEVRCRFTMCSTDGPVESAMIRCPAGHYFCGAIESLTWDGRGKHDPGEADPPCGIPPPGRAGKSAARTPLPPTTWAALPASGLLSCARVAGPLPPFS
jgi:hypothetical protein